MNATHQTDQNLPAQNQNQNQKLKDPKWWNDTHTTGWARVQEAFHRDWEQTKADFSKTGGHELNQGVGDTVKQAAGKEPIPPGNQPNPPDMDDIKKAAKKADDEAKKAVEKRADATVKAAEKRTDEVKKAADRMADETKEAADQRLEAAKIGAKADKENWTHAEGAYRYGWAARQQYANKPWDSNLESSLRTEWSSIGGTDWDENKTHIQSAWRRNDH